MPTLRVRDAVLTVRCAKAAKDKLAELIPDATIRTNWVNDLLEYGMAKIEAEKKRAG